MQCILLAAQNVGIGTNSPNSSALMHISSTTKGLLIPSMTTTQRNAIVSPAEGLLVYNNTTFELNQRQNGAWRGLINNEYWFRGANTMWNIGDNIGINTAGPTERLDVSGNIRTNSSLIIEDASAIMQLKNAGVNKGFIQLSGDNLRLGTNSGNTNGAVVLRMDGTDMIEFKRTINGGSFLQMNLNGISTGILQTTSTGNVSLTAVNSNAQLQLGGEVFINNTTSRTGIGTSAPTERLHVNGNVLATGDANIAGNAKIGGGRITSDITTASYNLLPVCYGRVDYNGNKQGGTPNFTIERISVGKYYIYCDQASTSSIIMINVPGTFVFGRAIFSSDHISVYIHDDGRDPHDAGFQFVVFNP